ncbi:MAG: hypothetical protein Ta2A_08190 [Treponemataceae bacterium]|nr:MAG: hypothetical protein Ta2A_08190 [Treponemataceae bacterium]
MRLKMLKDAGANWRELSDKDDTIYIPLLNAFMTEFKSLYHQHNDIMPRLIEYLLGSNGKDYYKLIHHDNHITTIMPFNIYGTLNQSANGTNPHVVFPKIELPTRIIELALKGGSKTTAILTMDNGWSISFRIHNASTVVEPSLKFDIQLQSKPEEMFYLDIEW